MLLNENKLDEPNVELGLSASSKGAHFDQLLGNIPSTRYFGSKRKLIGWLVTLFNQLEFTTAADLFGGTASVSLLLKYLGKQVTFNDVLVSNTIMARALLSNRIPISELRFKDVMDEIAPEEGFISKNFGGIFYTDEENQWLDGAISRISNLDTASQTALYYCLFQACLQKRPFNLFHRANLSLRTAQTQVRTFGNLATWNTHFSVHMQNSYGRLRKAICRSEHIHSVLPNQDAMSVKPGYDLVYLDPPYINRSGQEDYLRMYHFLEGLASGKAWSELINRSSKCLAFQNKPEIREWHKKSTFKEKLFELIRKHKKSIVVLSYASNAYPSISDLEAFFASTFSKSRREQKEHRRVLSKQQTLETVLIGIPK